MEERPARLNRGGEADRDAYRRSAAPRKYTSNNPSHPYELSQAVVLCCSNEVRLKYCKSLNLFLLSFLKQEFTMMLVCGG